MTYTFRNTSPAPVTSLPTGTNPSAVMNGLQMIRQAMNLKAQREDEQKRAEEQARQFGLTNELARQRMAANIAAKKRQLAISERNADVAEGQLGIQRLGAAQKSYDRQRQAELNLREEQALAESQMAQQTLGGNIPDAVIARARAAAAAQAENERKSGLEMVDEILGQPAEQPQMGAETPEFALATKELASVLKPVLDSDNPDERYGAEQALKQVPGLLKQYGGDKEKAGEAATKLAAKYADARAAERRSKRNAAAASAARRAGAAAFDKNAFESGAERIRKVSRDAGALDAVNAYGGVRKARDTLRQFGKNPGVYGSMLYDVIYGLSGQKGQAVSNRDLDNLLEESFASMTEGVFAAKFLGTAGQARLRKLDEMLQAAEDKTYAKAKSGYYRAKKRIESITGGRAGGTDYAYGAESGLDDYLPIMDRLEAEESKASGARRIRVVNDDGTEAKPKAAKPATRKELKDFFDASR